VLGIRPESFEDAAAGRRGLPTLQVMPVVVEELGSDEHVFFTVDAPNIATEGRRSAEEATLLAEEQALFSARVDARTGARVGQPLQLTVDPSRFHFFDPETGSSLLSGEREPTAEPELVTTQ
jgi:multiple sugar transport system ATP-binding protein